MNIGEQTWVSPVPYRHDKDAQALRNALAVLTTSGGLKQKSLLREFDNAPGSKTKLAMSLPTFRRFIRNIGNCDKLEVLEWIWDYLHAHSKYRAYLTSNQYNRESEPKRKIAGKTAKRTAEAALSDALQGFLLAEKKVGHTPMSAIRARFPGRYIMYRADLRGYVTGAKGPKLFRVSPLTIKVIKNAVCLTEEQNYPKTKTEAEFTLKTKGLMFPYGRYVLIMMHAHEVESFRLAVVSDIFPFVDGVGVASFQGTFLVASQVALFPSTPFFCLRDDECKLKTGRLSLNQIPNAEARAHLRNAHKLATLHYSHTPVIKR